MKWTILGGVLLAAVTSGCTSDPYAPVNQATPIRQMDNMFQGRPTNAPPPGYYNRRDAYDYDRPYPRY